MKFRSLIAQVREEYDIVIVDSPPILGLADAIIISSLCDGSLIITEQRGLRSSQIESALRRLAQGGGNIVGGILTKFNMNGGKKYSGYYNYYAYGDKKDSSQRKATHKKPKILIK